MWQSGGSIEQGPFDLPWRRLPPLRQGSRHEQCHTTRGVWTRHAGPVHELCSLKAPIANTGNGPARCSQIDAEIPVGCWSDTAPGIRGANVRFVAVLIGRGLMLRHGIILCVLGFLYRHAVENLLHRGRDVRRDAQQGRRGTSRRPHGRQGWSIVAC